MFIVETQYFATLRFDKNYRGRSAPIESCAYDVHMKAEYDFSKGKRGAVVAAGKNKTRITIRLDDDILEWFRNEVDQMGGGKYQTLINTALKHYIREQQTQPLEALLRRVVREELLGTKVRRKIKA